MNPLNSDQEIIDTAYHPEIALDGRDNGFKQRFNELKDKFTFN